MSRNPILNDQAFHVGGGSPADEWNSARAAGAGSATAAAADAAMTSQRDAHLQQRAGDGKVMTMGGVAAATGVLFGVLLVTAFFGWQSVDVTQVIKDGVPQFRAPNQPLLTANFTQPILVFGTDGPHWTAALATSVLLPLLLWALAHEGRVATIAPWATLPVVLVGVGLTLRPPSPQKLRVVGWTLVAATLLSGLLLVASLA